MSSSLYRLIGSTVRAIVTGVSTAVVTMLVFFIGSGFVLLRHQIPDYWIWMFWVSPLQVWLSHREFRLKCNYLVYFPCFLCFLFFKLWA